MKTLIGFSLKQIHDHYVEEHEVKSNNNLFKHYLIYKKVMTSSNPNVIVVYTYVVRSSVYDSEYNFTRLS